MHYLEGFRRLGCEIYYVEDTAEWPYDPQLNSVTDDPSYTVAYISCLMERFGLADHWSYCCPIITGEPRSDGTIWFPSSRRLSRVFGLSESQTAEVFHTADVLVNLTGSTRLREDHLTIPVRVYLETDPVMPQIEVAKANQRYIDRLGAHTHHLTFGENFGAPDCRVPLERFAYHPTRQPVILDWWTPPPALRPFKEPPCSEQRFTTVASWRQTEKDIEWKGETYTWSKHQEFMRLLDLPSQTTQQLELALALKENPGDQRQHWTLPYDMALYGEDAKAIQLLTAHGWRIINATPISRELRRYQDYILRSRGEFTVAKDQNVRMRSGWFSDRSACYLAAGRPVITQDTGFSSVLPTGEGLFPFNTMEDILAAFDAINSDYERHSRAARAIAEEYFRAETVLKKVLDDLGL